MARLPLRTTGAKLLVLSGGGPHAELATHLAATLGKSSDASITVFHAAARDSNGGTDETAAFDAQFARYKQIATAAGAANVYQRTGSGESIIEAILQESERGYDPIFAGASQVHGHAVLGGEVLRGLLRRARAGGDREQCRRRDATAQAAGACPRGLVRAPRRGGRGRWTRMRPA